MALSSTSFQKLKDSSGQTKPTHGSATSLRSRWNDTLDSSKRNDQWSLKAISSPQQVICVHDSRTSSTPGDSEEAFQKLLGDGLDKSVIEKDSCPMSPQRRVTTLQSGTVNGRNLREEDSRPMSPQRRYTNIKALGQRKKGDEYPSSAVRRSTKTDEVGEVDCQPGPNLRSLKSAHTEVTMPVEKEEDRQGLRLLLVKKDSSPSLVHRSRSGQSDRQESARLAKKVDSCPMLARPRTSDGSDRNWQRQDHGKPLPKTDSCPFLVQRTKSNKSQRLDGGGLSPQAKARQSKRRIEGAPTTHNSKDPDRCMMASARLEEIMRKPNVKGRTGGKNSPFETFTDDAFSMLRNTAVCPNKAASASTSAA